LKFAYIFLAHTNTNANSHTDTHTHTNSDEGTSIYANLYVVKFSYKIQVKTEREKMDLGMRSRMGCLLRTTGTRRTTTHSHTDTDRAYTKEVLAKKDCACQFIL